MVFCKKSNKFVFYTPIFHYICHAIDKSGPMNTVVEHSPVRDKAEYLLSLISHFAKRNGLNVMQAYRYVKRYGGVRLIDEHYPIMHTLSFDDALDSLTSYLKRQGGAIS